MTRHSFTFDFIPSATEPTKVNFSVKHIPVTNGVWGKVTYLVEIPLSITLSELKPEDLLWVAHSLAQTAASKIQMQLMDAPEPGRK